MQANAEGRPAFGSAWHQWDFDVITSARFKKVVEDNSVKLVGWKGLKPAVRWR